MNFIVKGINQEEADDVIETLQDEWEVDDGSDEFYDGELSCHGTEQLTGGLSDAQFADRVSKAIWKKLGRFVVVNVSAMDLEDPPTSNNEADQSVYDEWLSSQ
jgi:hypothetical protein